MPSKSSGRIVKANRHKILGSHNRNHRWETFTSKISKFNSLHPLRKVRRHDLETEDLSATTSYFQTGLQKWGELNVSTPFVSFKREVLPLSESLPQILHFEKRIMELLAKYISMQDKEALEPLLDLLTAFAHDLGMRFEKYYGQSLTLIVAIAGRPQPVEVIEWTFGALAFLFKYLSKLLVPNLRPTFDAVSPLMGKARHPPHIARFAAEALSFLVKKAGAPSHRETSLPLFVRHVKSDLLAMSEDRQFMLYKDGVMTMFAEAIKGNEYTVHSAGQAIVPVLMDASLDDQNNEEEKDSTGSGGIWVDVVCGVLTSTVHHTTPDTFEELCETILEKMNEIHEQRLKNNDWHHAQLLIRVLGVLSGVRRGNRVRNWPVVIQRLVAVLGQLASLKEDELKLEDDTIWNDILVNVAIIWHHAPVESLILQLQPLTLALTKGPMMRWFIPFCSYCCDLDATRFGRLLRNEFQKFIASHWSQETYQDMLCVFLPKMIESQAFPAAGDRDSCKIPQGWQDQIVSKFETLEISPFPERGPYNKDPQVWRDRCLPKYSALLRLLELTTVHPSTNARIAELLLRKLKLALRPSSTLASDEVHFIVGQGFHAYLRMSKAGACVDTALGPLLRAAIPRFARSVGFLQAYLAYENHLHADGSSEKSEQSSSDGSASDTDPVTASLVENLSSPSHEIRLVSLQLLKQLNSLNSPDLPVDIMLDVEQLPPTLDHTRTIAMLLRNLAQKYASLPESSWLRQGVPNHLFGMLNVKLSPVWDEATDALKAVSESKHGEDAVGAIAFRWMDMPSPRWSPPAELGPSNYQVHTDFDCTVFRALQQKAERTRFVMDHSDQSMRQSFDENRRAAEPSPTNARSRALKVFNAIPSLAEKRSRVLVPHFLSWASEDEDLQTNSDDSADVRYWSLADRKALIEVFSKFINPKVLYQQASVYDALLQQLENGDAEVQRLALKAILAWKQEGVKPYQENLEYLLDEARFKNELTVFLQSDDIIKPEHRAELTPVLLRLLYGRTISKKGASSGKHGLQATRLAVLRNLSVQDMGEFLSIALGKLRNVRVNIPPKQRDVIFEKSIITPRKQVGFLNMATSLISELGTNVTTFMDVILNAVLYCLVFACRQLNSSGVPDTDDDTGENDEAAGAQSLLKQSRSTGIKCLNMLFQNAQSFQWDSYHDIIVEEVVVPRLERLPAEMTQGVSGVLQLLATWSALPRAALLLAPRPNTVPNGVLPPVIECLAGEKTKDDVRIFVLGIIRNLVRIVTAPAHESEFNELIQAELLDPNAQSILSTITTILGRPSTGTEVLDACVETMLSMAPTLHEGENVESIIQISSFLLKQPPRRVSPKTKGRILLVVESFVTLMDPTKNNELRHEVYNTLCSLFSYFKDRENRQSLSRAVCALSAGDDGLTEIANICVDLNSYKEGRIDEPDYDRRLKAFNSISQTRDTPLTPQQWLPVLHNCMFFIRADEEFGVLSTNSADAMRRFVKGTIECQPAQKAVFEEYMTDLLLPAIYSGAKEPSDTVRREILRVLSYTLQKRPTWEPIKDMSSLGEVQQDSTEPPFFFNILSPATSRQLEAIALLEMTNSTKEIGSHNLAQFFIPLLEHFIFGRTDGSDDHGLGARASNAIGNLAMSLHWKHYRSTLQRYIGYIASKPDSQKQTIRLLGHFTDALATAAETTSSEQMETEEMDASSSRIRRLSLTMPKAEQLTSDVVNVFLPTLVKHLHEKDESEVSYRVPVGVTIVKLLKLLSSETMDQKLAGVLTDISHILRSKSSESRDLARDTLVKIATILGASHFGFILKELRGALTKGYQLHVLSYTVHSILVATVPGFGPGDLDYCLPSLVTVILDDIFGVIGQEKDAEGYISQMKEVKSSKSQDSMELIAKTASITHLIDLVRPLQALLMEKVDLKMIRKIDTLMARITSGLLQNPAAESRDTLVFCYEVIQKVYNSQQPQTEPKIDPRVRKYLVQKGAKKSGDRGKTTRNTFKLLRFSIDILRAIFKKHDSLRTPDNVAGFLPILGDAILDGEHEVKISAFRLIAVIVKVPFTNDDGTNIYKVAVKEATKSISTSSSTTTELSQAALKMLAVVLRDRRDVVVKDAAIDLLLAKLKDDLTEPLYRHVTFNFLRSIMERRIETAAVYDIMDHVGVVMITNDDKDTRDLARGAFFQFIREYPQKKARWAKQLNFIVANLKYDREGGRLSIMEVIHLLLMKSSQDFVQEVAATCFLPLFFVMANDDSDKCRLAASQLMKQIFQRSDKERTQKFLGLLRSWLDKDDNPAVLRLAIQLWAHYFESNENAPKNKKDFQLAFGKAVGLLGSDDLGAVDGELVETTLALIQVLANVLPEKCFASTSEGLWSDVARATGHPHSPAKLASVRLISLYLSDFAKSGSRITSEEPIQGSSGLVLDKAKIQNLVRLSLNVLNGKQVDEALATEVGQVLIFLGPCLPVSTNVVDDVDLEQPAEDQDVDDGEDDGDQAAETKERDLEYLFWRLSHILRKEIRPKAEAITSKVTAMEVLETICRRSAIERLEPSFKTILAPLHNLTDPTIAPPRSFDEGFTTKHEHLKTRAQILMDSLQKKFGTAEYSKKLMEIREAVKAKRRQRSSKRKIEAIAHPEKYGRDKRKKFEKNRERKKTRSAEQKSMRQSYKGW